MKTIRKRKSWKINPQAVTVWDNFFTDEYLDILRNRVLYAKHFDEEYRDYYAIDYFKNQDYLSEIIAKELSSKIDLPPFQRAWSFLYHSHEREGVRLHSDPSIVNLNIWVSTDKAIKDKSKNGLTIYKVRPPKTWTSDDWNGNSAKSTVIFSGISAGKHITSISVIKWLIIPPSIFTPGAISSLIKLNGIVTLIF